MEELSALKELVKKELKEVGNKGLTSANLESTSKLVDILKDLTEVESEKKEMMPQNGSYRGPQGGYGMPMIPPYAEPPMYSNPGGYGERRYSEPSYGAEYYGPGGSNGGGRSGRGYSGYDERMRDRIERIIDGAEKYEYGRDRYQHSGGHEAMEEGLEKMMYAVCMLVETAMDAAQSPREKEIIRKHVQKIRNL